MTRDEAIQQYKATYGHAFGEHFEGYMQCWDDHMEPVSKNRVPFSEVNECIADVTLQLADNNYAGGPWCALARAIVAEAVTQIKEGK